MAEPVIIEAAINGVTGKTQNPNTPKEPAEIAEDALRCFTAGAAVVHNHIDSFALDGRTAAERYLEGWRPALAERPDALFYPTTNAGADVEASYAHIAPLAESGVMRLSLGDPGSVNLGGPGPDGLPASGIVYANSFDDVAHQFGLCARYGLGPSIAIYEPGFLRCVLAWWRDVVREAEFQGHHKRVVQISHRYGMILFIASEVMFFVAWFWAYFNTALFPADVHQFARGALLGCGNAAHLKLAPRRYRVIAMLSQH